ncbi:hypothetical protein WAK64_08760 [Bacillus spongiae]|uniref:Uncharacterized protein n=1 Tax=Bacillus spongiae TaxID=2683610 RepID=A0ABU8HCZ6_9BACI
MSKQPFEEHKVKELLREMPKVKDARSKEDIYLSVQKEITKKGRGIKGKVVPSLAIVAAVILLSVVSTRLLYNPVHNKDDVNREFTLDKSIAEDNVVTEPKTEMGANHSAMNNEEGIMEPKKSSVKNAVYEKDVQSHTAQSFGVETDHGIVVPITILSEKDEENNWFENYLKLEKMIPEHEWGFQDQFPINAKLSYDDKQQKLLYTFPSKEVVEKIGRSSDSETNFFRSLEYTFSGRVKEIEFKVSDGTVPQLPNYGTINSFEITEQTKRGYFLYEVKNTGKQLYVPSSSSFENISDAFLAMAEKQNSSINPIIPEEQAILVKNEKGILEVGFQPSISLDEIEERALQHLIEGILLTAKSFGYQQVQFDNLNFTNWNGWDFSNPVEVPYSANKFVFSPS